MKTGDMVRLNLDPCTNDWLAKARFSDTGYFAYIVNTLGQVDGKDVYLRKHAKLVKSNFIGIVIDVEECVERNPVIVMIDGGLFCFARSELFITGPA